MTTDPVQYPNRLRGCIKASGYKVKEVAEETKIPLRTLFDYCAGRIPIPRDRLETIAEFLGYAAEYIAPRIALRPETTEDDAWIPSEVKGVDRLRRKLLQQLMSIAGMALTTPHEQIFSSDPWERLSHALHKPHSTDEETLIHLEALTDTLWELYRSALAKVHLLSSVVGHLQTVTQLLQSSQPTSVQQRLCSIVSNTAQIVGEIYFDMNNCAAAEAYYTLAIEAAQEAKNDALWALALGRKGFLPIYNGQFEKALPVLQKASTLAKQTTTGQSKSWLVTMKAEALAHLHRKSDCFAALDQANAFLTLDATTGSDVYWTGFNETTLAGYKGVCYTLLHMPDAAQSVLRTSLAALPPGPTRRKSIVLTDLALTYVQQEEIEEACRIAMESLEIAAQAKSTRALQRLRTLQAELKPWRDHASVRRLEKQLKIVKAL